MDDSQEIIFNIESSKNGESDHEDTLPLDTSYVGLTNDKLNQTKPQADSDKQNEGVKHSSNEIVELQNFFKDDWKEICNDFNECRRDFTHRVERLTNEVNAEIRAVKGRINSIDESIANNIVTIRECTNALQKSKSVEASVASKAEKSKAMSETNCQYQMNVRDTIPEQMKIADHTHSSLNTENLNQNQLDLDSHMVSREPQPLINYQTVKNIGMKPQLYEGDDDLNEYLAQFEILAEINNWDYVTKSLYLAGSLKGVLEHYSMS